MRLLPLSAILAVSLGAVEAAAYWWMHPAPSGLGEPVLVYRPRQVKAEKLETEMLIAGEEQASAQSSTFGFRPSTFDCSTYTPLPEVVARSLPLLHCTTGTAARIDRDGGVTLHLAFFEWDQASSNVLEAFKHLPEQCMGSIGMTLFEKAPPRFYTVREQETGIKGQGAEHSSIQNSEFKIQNSTPSGSLLFDHTIFRDPGGVVVHAFKGIWVSGASNLLATGHRGGLDEQRMLRWKAALKRFRPAYGRVAQGAVRGIQNPDLAWKAFEETMLVDLKLENQ